MQPVGDLIYDVGMHRGEDTAAYLAMGYRVVAVEANPKLVESCQKRFADALDEGTLTIVAGAIAKATEGTVTFYLDDNSQWGSIDSAWVRKKQILRAQRPIEVPAVDLAACMRRHGVPHYMKIDIEGADKLCLEALRGAPGLPELLSMEAELFDFDVLRGELELLEELGYRKFAVVRQGMHGEQGNSSGPFGESLGAAWSSRREAIRCHRRAFRRRKWLARAGIALRRHPLWIRHPRLWQTLTGYYDTHAQR